MNYPKTILNLIESFKKLPGIGEKTAERLALSTLNMDDDTIEIFSNSLKEVKNKIKKCEKCGSYTEEEICDICKSETRDHSTMCVVEESKNVIQFEKVGTFNGVYHVLGGLISPLDGVNPENINLNTLKKRIKEENIKEVILAIKPSIEGETTALYISKMLEDENIKITKIAHGIPMGADIDYIDPLTLEIAMEDRTTIS
ncbi:MAG TPA: recombination protein RecR [Candidatus Coprosoma intestinipullorum]|uniref:Recombination protein RecR n=1 Tax=Candidatus Coprosoma intestinipullorum TaxID=2840752 RepID=A0A9D0ZS62_9FIRM|nr:recombination protein RecR [Candidatus Coprosoma intestinipullorum]